MKRRLLLIILTAALFGSIAYFLWQRWEKKSAENELVLYGNVDVRQVDIGFRIAGIVQKMPFEEGDLVNPGDLLAMLDASPYIDQLRQAEANTELATVQLANAENNFKRRQELVSGGGVSTEDLENAQATYLEAQATLKASKASYEVAKANLSYIHAYCPSEGIILTRIREPGSVVNAADPVYTLSLSNPLWIRTYIAEPHLGQIYPGMAANIYTDTPGGQQLRGYIGFISPLAEFTPKTVETTQLRTDLVYRLRIYIDDARGALRQGQPVTVKIPLHATPKS